MVRRGSALAAKEKGTYMYRGVEIEIINRLCVYINTDDQVG